MPVYNDAARLSLCLGALEAQTYPRQRYEVIVVDNGSTDDVVGVLGRFPLVFSLCEETAGSYAARNAAIPHARGEVLAFTDSDCLPAPDWLEAGVRRLLSEPGLGFVGGRIELTFRDSHRLSAAELYDSLFAFPQEAYVARQRWAATANMLTLRSVIECAGPFDASLRSSGDVEWGRRVSRLGYGRAYAPEVVVRHPARRSLRELLAKTRRTTGGRFGRRRRRGLRAAARGLRRELVPPVGTARALLSDPRLPNAYDRGRAIGVAFAVWAVTVAEQARLLAGGQSKR